MAHGNLFSTVCHSSFLIPLFWVTFQHQTWTIAHSSRTKALHSRGLRIRYKKNKFCRLFVPPSFSSSSPEQPKNTKFSFLKLFWFFPFIDACISRQFSQIIKIVFIVLRIFIFFLTKMIVYMPICRHLGSNFFFFQLLF